MPPECDDESDEPEPENDERDDDPPLDEDDDDEEPDEHGSPGAADIPAEGCAAQSLRGIIA